MHLEKIRSRNLHEGGKTQNYFYKRNFILRNIRIAFGIKIKIIGYLEE